MGQAFAIANSPQSEVFGCCWNLLAGTPPDHYTIPFLYSTCRYGFAIHSGGASKLEVVVVVRSSRKRRKK